ncbi:hypothetical protein DSO57_1028962 [Entomophthora muscae]|uniref:Uncharacterized protein n=1 Tax=Entomophthora muscae TaxID=34485 RepID=A0ACC2S372_9FUNG|nr:hypothetical protein DSO57_1028962 [Entomophthora muscae]
MVLTTGALSTAFTPYDAAFIGPACSPPAGSTLPIISSPPFEEEILDSPDILTAVIIFPQQHLAPLLVGMLILEQIRETALVLDQGDHYAKNNIPKLRLDLTDPKYYLMMFENGMCGALAPQTPIHILGQCQVPAGRGVSFFK